MAIELESQTVATAEIEPALGNLGVRVHYLDNLRAIAMMLGVFLHAAFAYADPAQSFWLAADTKSSKVIDAFIWFLHLFRMGLFYLLSGYFAKLVIVRKGLKSFAWNRTLRLVFPFVLFYPFLLVAMSLVVVFGLSYLKAPTGLMGLFAEASKQTPVDRRYQPLSTMHLWFLYYLVFFSAIAAVASRFPRIQFEWLIKRCWLLGLAPLALIPGIVGAGVPLPSPESFVPTWWPFAFYGLFYWAGWQFFGREIGLERLAPYVWRLVAFSLLLFVLYYGCMPVMDLSAILSEGMQLSPWAFCVGVLLTAYLSVALTVAALLLGKRFLQGQNGFLKFIADASYWVYLTHLPIAIFLQVLLVPLDWYVWVKLSLTLLGTTSFCLATYLVFVRYTPVGWLLHGKRTFP